MRMTLFQTLTLLLVVGLAACDPSGELETRSFDLDHLDPEVAYEFVLPYVFEDRPESPGSIGISHEARSLTVRERPDNLDRIARVLEVRDQPRPRVTLHFQIIEAGPEELASDPTIAEVEAALREVFRFRGYRLIGEAVVHAVDRRDFRQMIAGPAAHDISGTLWAVRAEEGGPSTARLSVTFWRDIQTMALETTVNLVDGHTVVLGTAGRRGEDGAIILAVRPVFEP